MPPTGKLLEVPFTAIVNIRGDRLFHEHIAWDQATLLRQLGLLPEVGSSGFLPSFCSIADSAVPSTCRFRTRLTEGCLLLGRSSSIESLLRGWRLHESLWMRTRLSRMGCLATISGRWMLEWIGVYGCVEVSAALSYFHTPQ